MSSSSPRLRRLLQVAGIAVVIAAPLIAFGVLALASIANDASGQMAFGADFGAYHAAARRILNGESLYAAFQLAGPYPAQADQAFVYPPHFALLITPLALLPELPAALTWMSISALTALVGVYLALRAAGRSAGAMTWLLASLACAWCMPLWDTLIKGNVEGLLVLAIGIALYARTTPAAFGALGVAALIKVTPFFMLLPLAMGWPRSARRGLVPLLLIAATGSLFLLTSMSQFPAVLFNLAAGSSDASGNLALAQQIEQLAGLGAIGRAASIAVAAGAMTGAVICALRRRWVATVFAGAVVGLLLPATIWYHYLALLLPFAAYAAVRSKHMSLLWLAVVLLDMPLALGALEFAVLGYWPLLLLLGWFIGRASDPQAIPA